MTPDPMYPQPYQYPYRPPVGGDPTDPLVSADFSGWWRRGFRLVRAAWRPLAIVQLIAGVPALALLVPALVSFDRQQQTAQAQLQADTGQPDFSLFFSGLEVLLPLAGLAGLIYLVGQLAGVQIVVFTATGRTGGLVGPALVTAIKRFLPALGWYLLALPMVLLATALCFLPVLYVGAAIMVLPVVVVLERRAGIGRCFQLFHTDLGAAVSRLATVAGLSAAASVLLNFLTIIVTLTVGGGFGTQNDTASVINALLQGLLTFVSGIVLTPLIVAAYADLRARREPFTTATLRDAPA
jgi:hypothetical protein